MSKSDKIYAEDDGESFEVAIGQCNYWIQNAYSFVVLKNLNKFHGDSKHDESNHVHVQLIKGGQGA